MEPDIKFYLQTLDHVKATEDVEELKALCTQLVLMMAADSLTTDDFDWLLGYVFLPDTGQTMH